LNDYLGHIATFELLFKWQLSPVHGI